MVREEAVRKLQDLREGAYTGRTNFGLPPHYDALERSLETLGLYLAGGDFKTYGTYLDIVKNKVEAHDPKQVAVDAITLMLIERESEAVKR